jgi:hypothetical protein
LEEVVDQKKEKENDILIERDMENVDLETEIEILKNLNAQFS